MFAARFADEQQKFGKIWFLNSQIDIVEARPLDILITFINNLAAEIGRT